MSEPRFPPLLQRFEAKFAKRDGQCWIWEAAHNKRGYGVIWSKGQNVYAHRMSWLLYRGDIPDGQCALHHCDNPSCVNPDHLFLGTKGANNVDRSEKGRTCRGELSPGAKPSADVVRSIRSDSRTNTEIAKELGVSRYCVYAAKNHLTWGHIQ